MGAVRRELDQGVTSSATYMVEQAIEDWLQFDMGTRHPRRSPRRPTSWAPLERPDWQRVLRDRAAEDLRKALVSIGETRSTRVVRDARATLDRVITFAQARELIDGNAQPK